MRIVALLQEAGFTVTYNGDGVTPDPSPYARPYPFVSVHVYPTTMLSEALRLMAFVQTLGVKVVPLSAAFNTIRVVVGVCIHLMYDPADGLAGLDLIGLHDGLLPPSADRG